MPRGICASPFLQLVGRLNGNSRSALPHAELLNVWVLEADSQRPPGRIRLKIYIRIFGIFLPLTHNMIHYC